MLFQEHRQNFAGHQKTGKSILYEPELKLKNFLARQVPSFIQTYHLTYCTLLWSLINFLIAFYVPEDLNYLWIVCLMIVLQYITDLIDGEVGRMRKTGLVRWGFYMDHLLDFIFLSSKMFVLYFISPDDLRFWMIILFVLSTGFMISSFLSFAATNKFRIYFFKLGPTEARILFILIFIYIIFQGIKYFYILVPIITLIVLIALIFKIYQVQKILWKEDMQTKNL